MAQSGQEPEANSTSTYIPTSARAHMKAEWSLSGSTEYSRMALMPNSTKFGMSRRQMCSCSRVNRSSELASSGPVFGRG